MSEQVQPSASDLLAQRVEQVAQQVGTLGATLSSIVNGQRTAQLDSQLTQLQTSAANNVANAEAALKAAIESGDVDAQTKAYRDVARATAESIRIEDEIKRYRAQAEQERDTSQRKPDDTELKKFMAKHAGWYGKDQEMTSAAIAFAKTVEVNPATPRGSPGYFAAVEAAMKERFPDRIGETPPAPAGGGGGGGGGGTTRVPAALIDSWMRMGAITDPNDPKQIQEMLSHRDAAAKRGFLPEKMPGQIPAIGAGGGRILIR